MDRFVDLQSFVAISEAGSLSRAADRLGTTKSVVSRRLADLEARLGARLVNRGARGLTLTDAGRRFYERGRVILEELQSTEDEAAAEGAAPRGQLRIAAPVTFGVSYLSAALCSFSQAYPEVALDLDLDDRMVDLVNGGYDVAVRIGKLPDSTLAARKLTDHRHVLCASPDYLARRGVPESPEALKDHDGLLYSNRDPNPAWRLAWNDGEAEAYRVRARMRSNNGDILRNAALGGLGLVVLPAFIVAPEIERGALVPVLPGWAPPVGAISAVYPAKLHLSSKVRVFIDHLVEHFARSATWDEVVAAAVTRAASVPPAQL